MKDQQWIPDDAPKPELREGIPNPAKDESPWTSEAMQAYERHCEDMRNQQEERMLRRQYANKAFVLACVILGFWGIIISVGVWSGMTGGHLKPLSDKVLMAITAGATANVFAAFLSVIRGLFPSSRTREKS
jgi:hypothetical protein